MNGLYALTMSVSPVCSEDRRRSKKGAWQFQASESDLCNMQQLRLLGENA